MGCVLVLFVVLYVGSKYVLEGYFEVFDLELRGCGICVLIIEFVYMKMFFEVNNIFVDVIIVEYDVECVMVIGVVSKVMVFVDLFYVVVEVVLWVVCVSEL